MKGWFLDEKYINEIVKNSLKDTINKAKQSHMVDVILRLNGQNLRMEADWVKYMKQIEI